MAEKNETHTHTHTHHVQQVPAISRVFRDNLIKKNHFYAVLFHETRKAKRPWSNMYFSSAEKREMFIYSTMELHFII